MWDLNLQTVGGPHRSFNQYPILFSKQLAAVGVKPWNASHATYIQSQSHFAWPEYENNVTGHHLLLLHDPISKAEVTTLQFPSIDKYMH